MENEQIIQKILSETTALMPLKVDNEDVVSYKFQHINDLVASLHSSVANENYLKAFNLMQAAKAEEYKQFVDAASYEEKEQALIQLKHKAAEVSGIIQAG